MVAISQDIRKISLAAFWRIAARWNLTPGQQAILLATSPRTIRRWQTTSIAPRLSRDQIERVSYILGIFSGLRSVLGDTAFADEWVRRRNSDFGVQTPLDRMLAGNVGDLAHVRGYVDRWTTPW